MTPYGIVYEDNPFALEKSCEIWQKKFGVLSFSSLFKICGIAEGIFIIVSIAVYFLMEDKGIYFANFAVMFIMLLVFIYYMIRNSYVKYMARITLTKNKKQAVIYEDRIEFQSPYSKASYYYNEILYCCEKDDIITVIIDTASTPISIYRQSISKGDYETFADLLKEKMTKAFPSQGGMN